MEYEEGHWDFGAAFLFYLSSNSVALVPVEGKTLAEQMQEKLVYTQDILAGIAMENYDRIAKGANGLIELCEAVGWTEEKTKGEFEKHDVEFHQIADELLKLSRARNLEGAHYKYIQITTVCMDCHIHVRDVEKAEKYGEAHKYEPIYKGSHIHSR